MNSTPFTAFMRNGKKAHITGTVVFGKQHYLQGSHEGQAVELWRMNGHWSERPGAQHELDLVHVRSASGQIYAINSATP